MAFVRFNIAFFVLILSGGFCVPLEEHEEIKKSVVANDYFHNRLLAIPPNVSVKMGEDNLDNYATPLVFEGDILGVLKPGDTIADLNDKLNNPEKAALFNERWLSGDMYYRISASFTPHQKNQILMAMSDIEANTDAIRFIARGDFSFRRDYINIIKGVSCSSYVGRQGGAQELSLGNDCFEHGIIIHELMHALGFGHEQSRTDRDSYVDINWSNIAEADRHNFDKYEANTITTSGTTYDFGSVMHYGKNDFAIDADSWTIRPKSPWQNTTIGQRIGMSATDIREINALYKLCATTWDDYSGWLGIESGMRWIKGEKDNINISFLMSSAKVKVGCILAIYTGSNYRGFRILIGPAEEGDLYWDFQGQLYDKLARSAKCFCS
ncbi:high choriolytic enzyme 1-like [Paramacrobiotus metropolitanus]|uniref:high choriolytic enzyme 1-like n=1 Tax=Paramacrobiotus metropolitanus TaxID=2943436 RepID=UPI0024465C17|nr:high choriolytic enzyme 1-like [Paramacrobiotus metropolitanus]